MKRLNIKLSLWLVGITLVLVVGVHLLHGYQLERNADFLRLQAESAVKQGDPEEAIGYYNQYLKYRDDPKGYSAMAQLVVASAEDADATRMQKIRAYNILDEAIRRHPDLSDVRRRLIEFTILMGRYTDALDHIQYLNDKGESNPKLDLQKARCYLRSGEEETALKTLSAIVGFDEATEKFKEQPGPGAKEVEAFELLAQLLYRKTDGPKRATEVMNQLVAINPDSAKAHLARANFVSATTEVVAAKEDLDLAYSLAPDDPDVMLSMAAYAMTEKNYPRAQELLDKALASHPERHDVYLRLTQLAAVQNKPKEAIEYLKRGVERAADVQLLLPMLFDLQLQEGDAEAASKTCDAMGERDFPPEFVRFARACVKVAQNDFWEGSRELEAARPAIARGGLAGAYLQRLEFLLGRCYEALGLFDRQLEVARRVLQAYPGQIGARLSETFSLQRLGRYDEAAEPLGLLLGNVERTPALRTAVFQLLTTDQLRRPKDQRDWTKVNELAAAIMTEPSRSETDNALLKADLLMAQDKLEEAQTMLIAARKENTKDVRIWTSLETLLFRQNKAENVGPLLELAEKELGDVLPLRLDRIRLIMQEGGDTAVPRLEKLEQDFAKFTEPERIALMTQLGAAYLRLSKFDGSKRCWKYTIEHDPRNAQLRQVLFELMVDTNDEAGMKAVLQNIYESRNWGPQSALYKYCMAMSLIKPVAKSGEGRPGALTDADRKTLSQARRLINEAISLQSEWSPLWRVRAEIDQLEGNTDAAISSYQRALECSRTGQTVVARRLVRLLSAARRYAEADKALKYVGELSAADPLSKVASQISVETGDFEGALAQAEKDAQADPQNPANHIWLAHVLEQAGRTDDAEAEYRKAAEVGPDLPQAWLLLVRHLVTKKKMADAVAAIRQASPRLEKNRVTLAQMYELVGDAPQAEQFYRAALEANPQDLVALRRIAEFYVKAARSGPAPQFLEGIRKASPYLERIMASTKESKDPAALRELGWARRAQAEIVAAPGTYKDSVAAIKLVEQNGRNGKLAAEDIQVIVDMLAKRREPESRARAIRLIEQLQQIRPLEPREQFVLGQLYERTGDWPRAKDLMATSLTRLEGDPERLSVFVRSLIERGEYDDAARRLDGLDELLSKVPRAVSDSYRPAARELRARLLVKLGQPEQAVAVIEQLVPNPLSPNELHRLEQASLLLEELGQYDAARRKLDEYVRQEPRAAIAMAAYLGRRGEFDQAFARLEESRKNQKTAEVLAVGLEALRYHPEQATPERFRTLEQWAKAGLDAEPDTNRIKMLLAEMYDMQGRYADVVKTYREVLAAKETDPRQAAAVKNNLAFALAITKQSLPEALELIDQSINLMGPNSDLLDTRGLVYLNQGDVKRAIADLRLSTPDSPSLSKYFHLAQAEKQADNLDAARKAIAEAERFSTDVGRMSPLEQKGYQELVDQLK